ncbi:TolC family protein [Azospirillum doebereinerae]|nr:TolC family protein [Azospirillum doebereinerae]MCG5238710.1 TolC family protein [Azospirillum doebereinerae]
MSRAANGIAGLIAIVATSWPGLAWAQMTPTPRYAQAGAAPTAPPTGPEVRLTLPEAVYLGLRRAPAIRSAYLQRVLEKYNLSVSESAFSPKGGIVASVNADRTGASLNGFGQLAPSVQVLTPLGTAINFGWDLRQSSRRQRDNGLLTGDSALTLSVIQPLLKGAGYEVNMAPVREARLQERYNQLRLKATVADTITGIARAYHQFIQARQQVILAKGALQRARELDGANRALIAAGRMAEIELVQAQSTVAAQELATLQAENAFDATRLALLTLLAIDPETRILPADTLTASPVRVDLKTVTALAFDNRPDYLSQLIAIESARIGLVIATNQQEWDLSLGIGVSTPGGGRTGWRATEGLPNTKTDLRAGLQLTIPINNPAVRQREVQATVGLRQGEVLLEQIRAQVDQQVRDGVRTVDIAWRQYTLSRQVRELSAQTLANEMVKLRAGRSGNFQVVSYQEQLRGAENGELTALVAYLDALITLDQLLGTTLDTWSVHLNDAAP